MTPNSRSVLDFAKPSDELTELVRRLLSCGPLFDSIEINWVTSRNPDGLVQGLWIVVVVVPGETVHDALGRWKKPKNAEGCISFGYVVDDGFSHLHGAGRKFHPIFRSRMRPVAPRLLSKAEFFHGGVGLLGEAHHDEVEIVGFVLVLRVDRDSGATREHNRNVVLAKRTADKRRELFECVMRFSKAIGGSIGALGRYTVLSELQRSAGWPGIGRP